MTGKLGNGSSREFYRNNECLIDPSSKKLNENRKRFCPDAAEDKFEHAENKRAFDGDVELDFRPSKRFPITRQHQCLPCDATWFNDMLKHNKQNKLKREALGVTYSKEQKDSDPQFIDNSLSNRPNRYHNKYKKLNQSKVIQYSTNNVYSNVMRPLTLIILPILGPGPLNTKYF